MERDQNEHKGILKSILKQSERLAFNLLKEGNSQLRLKLLAETPAFKYIYCLAEIKMVGKLHKSRPQCQTGFPVLTMIYDILENTYFILFPE